MNNTGTIFVNKLRLCGVSSFGYYLFSTIIHDLHRLLLFYLQYHSTSLIFYFPFVFFFPFQRNSTSVFFFSPIQTINYHTSLVLLYFLLITKSTTELRGNNTSPAVNSDLHVTYFTINFF